MSTIYQKGYFVISYTMKVCNRYARQKLHHHRTNGITTEFCDSTI